MRLGVEAALVDGALVPGDVRSRRPNRRVRARVAERSRNRGPRLHRSPGQRLRWRRFPRRGRGRHRHAADALLETGVTAFLPTFTSKRSAFSPPSARCLPGRTGPRILGAHLEGPFLSALRLGIHPADARRNPDVELLERLLDAGPVRLVTLAPEPPGAAPVIERPLRREIAVSWSPRRVCRAGKRRSSTSACGASRISSTPCDPFTTATRVSSAPHSLGRTS